MRVFASCVAVALCAACGSATAPQHPASTTSGAPSDAAAVTVTPDHVMRARATLPPDYELSALPGDSTPAALWGLGASWQSAPPSCAGVVTPAATGAPASGWSASGAGGIVYVVVAPANADAVPAAPDECTPWTMSTDHTDADVTFTPAPDIADAATVGLSAALTSKVEGGNETHSQTQTLVAHLGGYVAYVVVVTDPGASGPPLAPDFAATLLTATVSAIRS